MVSDKTLFTIASFESLEYLIQCWFFLNQRRKGLQNDSAVFINVYLQLAFHNDLDGVYRKEIKEQQSVKF